MSGDMLENLDAVKQQLQTSDHGIAALCHQHREWQRSVESMLCIIENKVTSQALTLDVQDSKNAEATRPALEGRDQDVSDGVQCPTSSSSWDPTSTTELRRHKRSERYKNAKRLHSQRLSAIHPLLQSRKTVQQCPAGPLRKLLSEILPKTEETPPDLSILEHIRKITRHIVSSSFFEYGCGLVIFLNLIAIGFEAQLSLEGHEYDNAFWFAGVERMFLCIYCVEALLRAFSFGWVIMFDVWFILDLALVLIGALALVIVPLLASNTEDMKGFEKLLVVRSLRLLRLMRVLRMVNHFKIIWRLVYGFLTAWDTLFSSAALILLTLFIFSCIAIEVIAKDVDLLASDTTQQIVANYFAGVGRSMLTLVQFVTLDGLSDVYFPLIIEKPWLTLYFFGILMVISMGLLNLVTASLVENAMDNAATAAEHERLILKRKVRGALPSLIALFQKLDTDGSGLLTHDEVDSVPLDILPPRVLDSVYVDSMRDVFDLLDVDECGFLTQMEFVEGLLNLCLLDMPVATMQNMKLLKIMHHQLVRIEHALTSVTGMNVSVIDWQEDAVGI
eukprot:symbB.v1.2.027301.t1/scaffold2790.1/size70228/6